MQVFVTRFSVQYFGILLLPLWLILYLFFSITNQQIWNIIGAYFCKQVNDIHQADACKITPTKFSGSKEVVPLHFRKLVSQNFLLKYLWSIVKKYDRYMVWDVRSAYLCSLVFEEVIFVGINFMMHLSLLVLKSHILEHYGSCCFWSLSLSLSPPLIIGWDC